MEYNGFPVVRGRGMVKWNPFVNSTIIKANSMFNIRAYYSFYHII